MSAFRKAVTACAAAGAGLLLAVVPATSALAGTTIGQAGGDTFCAPGHGGVLADTNYVVPSGGGTITSFSFQSTTADAGAQIDFLVLRPGSGSYTVVGKAGVATLLGTGTETFGANIAVQGGDVIGFWAAAPRTPPGGVALDNCVRTVTSGGGSVSAFGPDPSVGGAVTFTASSSNFDLNESATLTPTPASALAAQLVSDTDHFKPGKALTDQATAIQVAVNASPPQSATACVDITEFLGLVKAQAMKKLTKAQATLLTGDANNLAAALGC
jgi:hypothetical protein